ncbi:Gfo/Idh/MocA family protein [Solirhodobacter olei]|uniref:Gfo/Idh/MocA family protein n=1 Tax=Solirhodobacter olei TaxID=2493082 RepID=UPI000FD99459|nr:Gfo/Idh/MocA family oxidoreductase [Solirhodobacter olei]
MSTDQASHLGKRDASRRGATTVPPTDRLRIAVVGLGKMGLSHFALINAHPEVRAIACDTSGYLTDLLDKYLPTTFYNSFGKMLAEERLDAVVIATPNRFHAPMVREALEHGLHVFCEKPFCLDWRESEALAELAERKGLVNQVGYHYRHVGAFMEVKHIVGSGALGRITHVMAEAYGPVVLQPKRQTWRGQKEEGGGCLYDYAAHPINLLNWYFGKPVLVSGSVLTSVYSDSTEDEVFSTLGFEGGTCAQVSVSWSDESQRKMTTKISMIGTNGRLNVDRQECQVYLRKPVAELPEYDKGWNVRYTTELSRDPWFYIRGEEYSNQLDDFVKAVRAGAGQPNKNDFRSAALTDQSIAMILDDSADLAPSPVIAPSPGLPVRKRSWFSRT